MKPKVLIIVTTIIYLIISCTPVPTELPEGPTSIPTPLSTATPTPILEEDFSFSIIGLESHGAVIEVINAGDWKNINEDKVEVILSQEGFTKERNRIFTSSSIRYVELMDSFYSFGPINVKLILNDENSTEFSYKVDFDEIYPWMSYLFGDSNLSLRLSYPWDPHHLEAWDIQPISEKFPDGDGHPVKSPCAGVIVKAEIIPESVGGDGYDDTHIVNILCDATGYLVMLGHMAHEGYVTWGDIVDTDTIVGKLHWEKIVGRPHNHFSVYRATPIHYNSLIDYIEEGFEMIDRAVIGNSEFVDPFNPHKFLNSNQLEYGFWLESTLPDQVKTMFKEGDFNWPE